MVNPPPTPDQLASLIDLSVDAVVLADAAGAIRWANAATSTVLGHDPAILAGIRVADLVESADRDAWQQLARELVDRPQAPGHGTFRVRGQDGTVRWIEASARNLLHEQRVGAIVLHLRDISDRKSTEEALKASEDRYGHLFDAATDIIFEADAEGYFRFVNPQTLKVFEYAADEVIGRRFTEFIRADYRPQILQHYYQQSIEGRPNSYIEFPALTKSGREVWLGQNAWLILDPAGKFIGMQAVARDVTERRSTEQALRAAEAKFRGLVEQSLMGVYILQNERLVYLNPKAAELLGYTQQELLDAPNAYAFVHEQDRAMVVDQLSRLGADVPGVQLTVRGKRKDGEFIPVEAFCSVTEFGGLPAVIVTVNDISDRVKLEDQLRQAQKMEAVGRLAGGIAHDFNNLLTIISGYSDLLLGVPLGEADHEAVSAIRDASERAAALTRQLLGFSRQTILQPKVLDLNAVVADMGKMLRRLIGADIQLIVHAGRDLHPVKVDPSQLDQAIVNLAVNARDAMPQGGSLRIETANVVLDEAHAAAHLCRPGPHVMLAMTDTGCGMTPDVQARIFEPFFTTKEVSKGTGLGLPMVFGAVQQNQGSIEVDSEPGRGTTFRIYLPAVVEQPQEAGEIARVESRGNETILLVEDEGGVRELAARSLRSRGYTVLAAADGVDALRTAESCDGRLDLLLTDVVMPRLSGPELVTALRARYPKLKALLMSGYTDDAVLRRGIGEAGHPFLQKPYTPHALAQKVREVLDQ